MSEHEQVSEDETTLESDRHPREHESIEDYSKDPRYDHLKDKTWSASKWRERFQSKPTVTDVPVRTKPKASIDQVISQKLSFVKKRRVHCKADQYDLHTCAKIWQKIGEQFDTGFDYELRRSLYRTLILWAIAHQKSEVDIDKGLLLFGPVGTGKTLAMQILQVFIKVVKDTDNLSFRTFKADEIVDKVMSKGRIEDIKRLAYRNVFVDDVGQESITVNYYGNEMCIMEKMIMYAYDAYTHHRTYMHISTNLLPTDFMNLYSPRVYSRIQKMFNLIEVTGDDFRQKELKYIKV